MESMNPTWPLYKYIFKMNILAPSETFWVRNRSQIWEICNIQLSSWYYMYLKLWEPLILKNVKGCCCLLIYCRDFVLSTAESPSWKRSRTQNFLVHSGTRNKLIVKFWKACLLIKSIWLSWQTITPN